MTRTALHALVGLSAATLALAAAPAGASTFMQAQVLAELDQARATADRIELSSDERRAGRARMLIARIGLPCPAGGAPGIDAYTEAGPSGPVLVLLLSRCDGRTGDVVSLPLAAVEWREID